MTDYRYVGTELERFAAARRWKSYWSRHVRPYAVGDVLEVGAGICSNTPALMNNKVRQWLCLEPDPTLAAQMRDNLASARLDGRCESVCGTLSHLNEGRKFDTILYLDVLEHIEDDRAELRRAASKLRAGGCIVVLAPAHQFLYSPFDAAIGHYRRYSRPSLRSISPSGTKVERLIYLDAVGLAASAANRLLLRQSMPSEGQLRVWDTFMVPASAIIDKPLRYSLGKSVLAVWRKPLAGGHFETDVS